jgi:hypothetical protein
MANKKINDLSLAASVVDTMQLETDIGGATANKVTALQLKNYMDIPLGKTESFTATAGQTLFTITVGTPLDPTIVRLYVNGQRREYGASKDYTISGNIITWYNNDYTMENGNLVQVDFGETYAGSPPVLSVFGRIGAVIATASDYDASQIDNDSGVAGAFVSDALDTLDSGKAASGANSDITSLSGLTTALSIGQGGTNSTTALANGKVMASSGGKIIESAVDISSVVPPFSLLAFGNNSVASTIVTRYMNPFGVNATASTSIVNVVSPFACTIKNMHVYHNNPAGNGNNIVYTLFKNGVSTSLTVTIPSTTQTASDTSNSVSVSAGDRLTIEVTKGIAIGASPTDIYVSMEVTS